MLSIADARELAREAIKRVRAGLPSQEPAPDTFEAVASNWLKRHVQANGLRSEREVKRLLNTHLLPAWGERPFASIRRGDVTKLLDHVEDERSAKQADSCLSVFSQIANWHAARDESYVSPVTRGMRRTSPKARARIRILDDDELRAVWRAAETFGGPYGAIVRLALLTAQRRQKLAEMKWADISDGVWHIPREKREKGTAGALVLSAEALNVIQAQPRLASNPYVFAGRGGTHFCSFGWAKGEFDALANIPAWVTHDLRRTARSLMSRAGVRPDISERVLGHVINGVEGIYDRHHYTPEKADALRRLAALLKSIVNPTDNVVQMRAAG